MKWIHHDLDTRNSDQVWELIERHGLQGYGFWWALLEECYSSEETGFQVSASETWLKKFSKTFNLADWRTPVRILDTMGELGLIDSQLWAEKVIHVPGIQARADDYVKKKTDSARRQAKFKAKLRVSNALPSVTFAKSDEVTLSEIRDQIQKSDPKSDPEKKEVSISSSPRDRLAEQMAARRQNRKDGPFDQVWESYQKNCIVVGSTPGSRPNALTAWAERFPDGAATPEFLEQLEAYWEIQKANFQRDGKAYPVGLVRFINEPEHGNGAIARQQLLAQAPQLANPRAMVTAMAEEEAARAKAARIARMEAKFGRPAS